MTRKDLLGFKYVDTNGIRWEITKVEKRSDKKDYNVTIKFDNNTEQVYSGIYVTRCANQTNGKSLSSIKANKSAYEYIGKSYTMNNGDELTIKSVNKLRGSYRLTLVEVEWKDKTTSILKLNNILKGTAKKSKERRNGYVKITNKYKDKNKGYCKLPDDLTEIYVKENIVNLHKNMMKRCYNNNSKLNRNDSYLKHEVKVHEFWHNIYNFITCCNNNYVEGYQLDKDLKGTGLLYSESTCIFIPGMLNAIITTKPSNDELPIGIRKTSLPGRKPYPTAVELFGNTISLGYHNSPLDGFVRVKIIKEFIANKVADRILTNSSHDVEIKSVVQNYSFKDIRKDNPITQEDVIVYMKLHGGAVGSKNYIDVKTAFINSNFNEFNKIFNKVNVILNREFGRP